MDWLTFISSIVKSLAWPAAFVGVILLLRVPIKRLLSLLTNLKWKDLEIKFDTKLEQVKRDVEHVIPESQQFRPRRADVEERVLDLLIISPAAAIIEAWREVEIAAQEAARRHQVSLPSMNLREFAERLHQAGVIKEEQVRVFDQLRRLRNLAAHGGGSSIGENDALDFVSLAIQLSEYLRRA